MMRKLCLVIIILIISFSSLYAQQLFLRKDKYFTEVYLKLDKKNIKNIEKGTNQVIISFQNSIKQPFSQDINDDYVSSIQGSGSSFVINIKPDAEFSIVNDTAGVKVVATKSKTNDDTLSSYGVAKPLLSTKSQGLEDKNMQDMLDQADRYIAAKQFGMGAQVLQQILASTQNEFYKQEAMYKLGETYLLMGQYDGLYYTSAYEIFDEFVKQYPDNFRTPDALLKSAQAKEDANQQFEAINTYLKIYNTVPDLETKRAALKKMAELYKKVGQVDKAIETYLSYLRNFKTDQDIINGEVGQMYYDMNEENLAFEYFSTLNLDELLNNPDTTLARLNSVADTFYKKNRLDPALKLYTHIYEKYPDDASANTAIFRAASILHNTGRETDADQLLLRLKQLYPDREGGQRATIEYAEKYLNTKPYEYWNKFFEDLFTRPDSYGLHEQAKYMLIKTLYKENRMAEAVDMISNFLGMYPESKYYDELNTIKEDYMFAQLSDVYNKKDYVTAEPLINRFNAEYPNSKYKPRTDIMLNEIKYGKIDGIYKNNDYKSVISFAEAQLASPDPAKYGDKARWEALLDEATYKDINVIYGSKNYPAVRAEAKEYLDKFKNGKYRKEVSAILENSMLKPMEESYKALDYPSVVQLYDANSDWIGTWNNKAFQDKVKTMVAMSVYRLGSPSKARTFYAEITPNPANMDYAVLGYLLGDKNLKADVNSFDKDTFKYIIGELEQLDTDMAVSLLDKYTRDKKYALSLKYSLAKNIPSDAKRQQILMSIYDTIRQDTGARFEGSNNVYMDIGLIFYRKNDFKNAVLPLKQFTDNYREKDDRRAEALYYLGKSFINMGDVQRGYNYYNDIISNIPTSIYAGIAKGEMEEDEWRKNLNK